MQVAKLDKASFLAELRGVGAVKGGAPLPAGTGPATAGPAVVPAAVQGQAQSPAWDVLSEGFGLQGRSVLLPSLCNMLVSFLLSPLLLMY